MLPLLIAGLLTIVCGVLCVAALLLPGPATLPAARLRVLTRRDTDVATDAGMGEASAAGRLLTVTAAVRARLARGNSTALQLRLRQAGATGTGTAELYTLARVAGPVLALGLAALLPGGLLLWAALLLPLAFFAPTLLLHLFIRRRRQRIARGMSDMLDLLSICVDAGLGLDAAVLRVAEEMGAAHPDLQAELLQINREQRAGKPRAEAWTAAVERVDAPEMTAFSSMVLQAERFGTPIARALGDYAGNVRLARIQQAEERAAKTTIKIIFPLALFIFPSIFIVLLGPAVLNILRNF